MISIKKYLDSNLPVVLEAEPASNELSSAAMECYRAALSAFGKTAVQISPGLAADLESNLRGLQGRLTGNLSPDLLARTAKQVEAQLQEWGSRTSGHLKVQADSVKELLIALARTAESLGSRDKGYAAQFKHLTDHLEKISDLNDLTQIRTSLVQSVTELKSSVEQMTRENHQLVSHLQAEVSIYETRLKSAEQLAFKDELTGLANRRSIEERIQWCIVNRQEFCILMLDLNLFKQVNDKHGHVAGDDLLRQFATELQSNSRPGDLVGRWGGDEFIIILKCKAEAAAGSIQKIRNWVFGKYTVRGPGKSPLSIHVDAAMGIADWSQEKNLQQLIEEADAAMYLDKKQSGHDR